MTMEKIVISTEPLILGRDIQDDNQTSLCNPKIIHKANLEKRTSRYNFK